MKINLYYLYIMVNHCSILACTSVYSGLRNIDTIKLSSSILLLCTIQNKEGWNKFKLSLWSLLRAKDQPKTQRVADNLLYKNEIGNVLADCLVKSLSWCTQVLNTSTFFTMSSARMASKSSVACLNLFGRVKAVEVFLISLWIEDKKHQ